MEWSQHSIAAAAPLRNFQRKEVEQEMWILGSYLIDDY